MEAAKKFGVLAGIALALGLLFFGIINLYTPPLSIEVYVARNITKLSPVEASMGGTFFVTGVTTKNKTGTVEFEDGHMSYTADFEYKISRSGKPSVTSFKIRP